MRKHARLIHAIHPPAGVPGRDSETGRFTAATAPYQPVQPPVTLNGGTGYSALPQAPRTPEQAEADHSRLMAALAQAPRVLPNLERA